MSDALSAHKIMYDIDNAVYNGNYQRLIRIAQVKSLLSSTVDEQYKKLTAVKCSHLGLRRPTLVTELLMQH